MEKYLEGEIKDKHKKKYVYAMGMWHGPFKNIPYTKLEKDKVVADTSFGCIIAENKVYNIYLRQFVGYYRDNEDEIKIVGPFNSNSTYSDIDDIRGGYGHCTFIRDDKVCYMNILGKPTSCPTKEGVDLAKVAINKMSPREFFDENDYLRKYKIVRTFCNAVQDGQPVGFIDKIMCQQ